MLKAFTAGIVVTIAAAVVGGYLLLQSGRIPANADATPSPIETWAANTSLDATLTREAPKDSNPITTSRTVSVAVKCFSTCGVAGIGEFSSSA